MKEKYCEICGERIASVEYIELVGGHRQVRHLCHVCAEVEANGIRFLTLGEFDRNINALLTCPECGMPLSLIKASLQVGCPECYNVFEGVIKDLLKRLQGSSSFIGKEDLKSSEEKDLIGGSTERSASYR